LTGAWSWLESRHCLPCSRNSGWTSHPWTMVQ
jgi:hypothetical protein